MGFASPYDADAAGKRTEFQQRLLFDKAAWELAHDDFVTDRTTLDNLAYAILHDVHGVDADMLDTSRRGMLRYTHVFFCPIDSFCKTAGDPNRVSSLEYQRIYEIVLRGMLRELQLHIPITFRTLVGSSLWLRQDVVRHYVQR
jgi:hypothetical protein